jgi:hypothetical protein
MALAAVGYSLRFDKIRGRLEPLGIGLGCRLSWRRWRSC